MHDSATTAYSHYRAISSKLYHQNIIITDLVYPNNHSFLYLRVCAFPIDSGYLIILTCQGDQISSKQRIAILADERSVVNEMLKVLDSDPLDYLNILDHYQWLC